LRRPKGQTYLLIGDHTSQHELGDTNDGGGGDLGFLLLETAHQEAKDDVGLRRVKV